MSDGGCSSMHEYKPLANLSADVDFMTKGQLKKNKEQTIIVKR